MLGNGLAGLAVTAHNDALLCASTFSNLTVSNLPPAGFGVFRELWTGLSSAPGNSLAALTNTSYNPNWPNNPAPNYTKIFNTFETEINSGMSYYGQRLRAFIVPPATGSGDPRRWIASHESPPTVTRRKTALNKAARIDEPRMP